MRIAIIGSGVSGLSCADGLASQGHDVTLFDKGRRPGGRMSTRRVQVDGDTLRFDHGAQYFTVRDPAFVAEVEIWERDGLAARWPAAGEDAWVGTPAMNAPVHAMAARHAVAWETRVDAIERDGDHWRLDGPIDAVIVAVPAEQAAPLLAPHHQDFAAAAEQARSAPCWTAMAAFGEPIGADREIVRDAGAIGWAARDGAKPGRGDRPTWVIQASPDWSADRLEDAPERIGPDLLALLGEELGLSLPEPVHLSVHRWRYARSGDAGRPGALWDPAIRLGACGDWLLAPRVEAAWLSGRCAATMVETGDLM